MNSSPALMYHASVFTGLNRHGWYDVLFVRDEAVLPEESTDYRIDALVRSGDYFITLATALDCLVVDADDFQTQIIIDDAMRDLMYLQDNYEVRKKH